MTATLHQRFLSAIIEGNRRSISRRAMLAIGATGGAAGTLWPSSPARRLLAQERFAGDLDILDFALTIEHLQAALYREGLDRFDEMAFAKGRQPDTLRPDLIAIRDQEAAHAETLAEAIGDRGGNPAPPRTYDFGYDDLDGFLEVAAELENIAVAAYADATMAIDNRRLLRTALGIHRVEARHAAYLNAAIGHPPFPDAIDAPLNREEALALIAEHDAVNEGMGEATVAPPDEPASEEPSMEGPPTPEATDGRFAQVLADAAARFGLSSDDVSVIRAEARNWPDASLGCPEPGGFYAQVITPGYLVVVGAAGSQLEYHTDDRGNFVLC